MNALIQILKHYFCRMNNINDPISLQPIYLSDLYTLQEMSRKTFKDAFSWGTSEENMKGYVDNAFSEEKLSAELHESESQFYFVLLNDTRVGYLKLNFGQAQTELKETDGMEIERIYVAAEHQGKKIGESTMGKAIEIAKQQKMRYVWLGVWEKNTKALSFYRRHGFEEVDSHPFMMGTEEQTDLIMRRDLNV
jgi:ribosomal protein S18 acetylase RimI-like enzyme